MNLPESSSKTVLVDLQHIFTNPCYTNAKSHQFEYFYLYFYFYYNKYFFFYDKIIYIYIVAYKTRQIYIRMTKLYKSILSLISQFHSFLLQWSASLVNNLRKTILLHHVKITAFCFWLVLKIRCKVLVKKLQDTFACTQKPVLH